MLGRGDRKEKEKKIYSGCAEFDVPAEHSRGCVGLELKSKVGKYGFKTIRLKIENTPRAWRAPAGSVHRLR